MSDNIDAFLAHHGILGMRWGVRHDPESKGGSGGGKSPPPKKPGGTKPGDDKERDDQILRKYGPDSTKDSYIKPQDHPGWDGLSPEQKKLILLVGGAALVGVGAYALYKTGVDTTQISKGLSEAEQLKKLSLKADAIEAETAKDIAGSLADNWDKGVTLEPGSVIQRLSTMKETEIRPSGFFAAYQPEDITKYKAKLPDYWKMWSRQGLIQGSDSEGYLVKIKAVKGVKAPSAKESIQIYRDLLASHAERDMLVANQYGVKSSIFKQLPKDKQDKLTMGAAVKNFRNFSRHWANGLDKDPDVQKYFKMVKAHGYNGLIDFNDAGDLAQRPLRLIDAKDFQITGHDPVGPKEIDQAKRTVALIYQKARAERHVVNHSITVSSFLEHHGLIGERQMIIEHTIFTVDQRKQLASKGQAMPNGSFPIRNREDFKTAVRAYTFSKNKLPDKNAAMNWIMKRAKELNCMDLVPDSWKQSMGMKQSAIEFLSDHGVEGGSVIVTEDAYLEHHGFLHDEEISDFLEHHGVKGMRWGVRKAIDKAAIRAPERIRSGASRSQFKEKRYNAGEPLLKKIVKAPNGTYSVNVNGKKTVSGETFFDKLGADGKLSKALGTGKLDMSKTTLIRNKSRRTQGQDARTLRLKYGKASFTDKLIREADLDGGRTAAIRSGKLKQSKNEKLAKAFAASFLLGYGSYQLGQVARDIKQGRP